MARRCNDKKCKGYGKELVDKGYGYPVCPTVRQNTHEQKESPAHEFAEIHKRVMKNIIG